MAMLTKRQGRAGVAALFATVLVIGGTAGSPASAHHGDHGRNAFTQRNLVSDVPGLAELQDDNVVNPWGIAFGPAGPNATPLWVNNNFAPDQSRAIQLYRGATSPTDKVVKVPLEIAASAPTGMVFNPPGGTDFMIDQGAGPVSARFLFNETDFGAGPTDPPVGRITGWAPQVIPPATTPPLTTTPTDAVKTPSVPFGLALVPGNGDRGSRLLVADAATETIDVYDAAFQKVDDPSLFVDKLAHQQGLIPYNVAFLKDRVYVAYARLNPNGPSDPGGAVSVFKANGKFKKRLITDDGKLFAPWGMVIAPKHWGKFGGRLLVGNVDDGLIHAYGRRSGHFKGTLKDASGEPLVNTGLWGLAFGNGVIGTPHSLIFAAGIGNAVNDFPHTYEHGLIGSIEPAAKEDDDD